MSGCEHCGVVGAHTCHRINPYAAPLASTTRSQYDDALGRTLMARGAGETRPMVSADTLAAECTRADVAEAECARLTTERDAARAEAAGLRAAITAERAVRAAWLATLPACASAPADVVAAEAATGAALAGEGRTTERAECRCGHPVEMHRGADRCGAYGCGCDLSAEEAGWS